MSSQESLINNKAELSHGVSKFAINPLKTVIRAACGWFGKHLSDQK